MSSMTLCLPSVFLLHNVCPCPLQQVTNPCSSRPSSRFLSFKSCLQQQQKNWTTAVAAPAQYKGARSFRGQKRKCSFARSIGVRIFSFLHQKSWRPFLVVAPKTQTANAADCFTVKIEQIKRSGFYCLFTLLPKQSNWQGGARAVDLPARSLNLARPGV